jgi:hypothetical protein
VAGGSRVPVGMAARAMRISTNGGASKETRAPSTGRDACPTIFSGHSSQPASSFAHFVNTPKSAEGNNRSAQSHQNWEHKCRKSITACAARSCAAYELRDIQSREGIMHLRVRGKRGKIRFVPVHAMAQRLIEEYLALAGHGGDTAAPCSVRLRTTARAISTVRSLPVRSTTTSSGNMARRPASAPR